jgi:nicotinate phosphoribosyltransferase
MRELFERTGGSWALLTDLYQLTMAYGYWKNGLHERDAVFHLAYRENPFHGAYSIVAGLELVCGFLDSLRFQASDVEYLAGLNGADNRPLFERAFLDYLTDLELRLDIDAIPEGTLAFAHEPLLRVRGPLLQAQILESPLLTIVNFQTLVATKAARICAAARGEPVLEFGMRRAQGVDGALGASRAAYIGGCVGTSNLMAGKLFDIPVRGTHAHSWVMCFEDELSAFNAYADALPNNCIFLVDTYDTISGVRHSIQVARKLRKAGHEMVGIRLDSGNLAELSIQARRLLDEAGFPEAAIVASSDLDEYKIEDLQRRGAVINVWGVGTRLATAYDQPALGGVYKLSALKDEHGKWIDRLKLSDDQIKVSNPGILQVRRYRHAQHIVGDVIFDERQGATRDLQLLDEKHAKASVSADAQGEDLLVPVYREGQMVYDLPSTRQIRRRASEHLAEYQRYIEFEPDQPYPVGLDWHLQEHKNDMMEQVRKQVLRDKSLHEP